MHIAAAVGVNTLGIFGVSDPRRTAPWGANYIGGQDQWPALADVLNYIEENV
jgi:heptosyltransferase-2